MSSLRTAMQQVFDIRRKEWPAALGLSSFFFLVIAIFWVLKPVKRGLFLAFYSEGATLFGWHAQAAELEQVGKILNMAVILLAAAAFTWLVHRVRGPYIILALCGTFSVILGTFAVVIGEPTPSIAWLFYVFGDVFNTMMVGAFWAFANDLMRPDQAKRLYGIVGLGGVLGGLFGATVVSTLVEQTGRGPLLAACVGALLGIVGITFFVDRHAQRNGERQQLLKITSNGRFSGLLDGFALTYRSRYLLSLAGLVAIYEIVSNIIDFQLAAAVQMHVMGNTDKDAFFAVVGQATGVMSIVVQLFLTSFVMRKFGVGAALLALPIAVLGGAVGFLVIPTLAFAAAMSASDNALHYSIDQCAKETLYVPTSRDAKYKAKAVIDMVIQRVAKVVAVGLNLTVAAWVGVGDVRWLSVITIALVGGWIYLARSLGRSFREREAAYEGPDAQEVVEDPLTCSAGASASLARAPIPLV